MKNWIKLFFRIFKRKEKVNIDDLQIHVERLHLDIDSLLEIRQKMVNEGKQKADVEKKRISSKIVMLDKDISRIQDLINIANKQINVILSHEHNKSIAAMSEGLPDSDQIVSSAVIADDNVRELSELPEVTVDTSIIEDDDIASIMKELSGESNESESPGESVSAKEVKLEKEISHQEKTLCAE